MEAEWAAETAKRRAAAEAAATWQFPVQVTLSVLELLFIQGKAANGQQAI